MQQPASRIHPSNQHYIMICLSFILFPAWPLTAYLARVFYGFKAMHLVYVLLYIFFWLCRFQRKWSKLGRLGNIIVWEVEGELIVVSASVFVFRIGSVSAPWDYGRV